MGSTAASMATRITHFFFFTIFRAIQIDKKNEAKREKGGEKKRRSEAVGQLKALAILRPL